MSVIDMKINDPDDFINEKHLTVFARGCNMKCDYCFNSHLIDGPNFYFSRNTVADLMKYNRQNVKYILFTGGEPTLSPDLYEMIMLAKDLNYYIEVCSNGTLSNQIEYISYYVDKFRIDFKAGYEYRHLFYTENHWESLDRTIRLLQEHENVEYRTVLHKDVTFEYLQDVLETAWLAGIKNYGLIHDINYKLPFDYKYLVKRYFPEYKEYRNKKKELAAV